MSDRHPLVTEGAWVQLRDPKTFKSGDKRQVLRAVKDMEGGEGSAAVSFMDGIAVVAVEAWSLNLPVPSADPAVLDMMEIGDYDALFRLLSPAQEVLFPTAPEQTPEQAADPGSPTVPSAA